ncbi:MAG TPA: translation initiation factor [Pseudobdellovibrionaceae bacterium]
MSQKNTKLVYSTDPKDQKCLKCKEYLSECTCLKQETVSSRNFIAIFRLEKNARGGKVVTVIDALPKIEVYLKDLCKELKTKCGVGGTYVLSGKEGLIEIQGDKRVQIKKIFDQKGIKYKGA